MGSDRLGQLVRQLRLRAAGVEMPAGWVTVTADSSVAPHASIGPNASLHSSTLGRRSTIGSATMLQEADVGAFCAFAWRVSVGAGPHPLDRATTHGFPYQPRRGGFVERSGRRAMRTRIGNDVWVGAHAVVLGGVTVGDGAVIAAQSAVIRDVAPYTIVAGVPARPLRLRVPEHLVARLHAVGWWEWPDEALKEHLDLFQRPVDDELVAALESVQAS
jgi:acetyltransferase-like isoleucine patch superfamily enzyme